MDKLKMLKKKNARKDRLEAYLNRFKKFNDVKWLDIEESTEIIDGIFFNQVSSEIIKDNSLFIDSDLLRDEYLNDRNNNTKSYVFTDDFEDCGIFLINTKEAIENAFLFAKEDYNNTFFILEQRKNFYFRINYYDNLHSDSPNTYDVQKSIYINDNKHSKE